MTRNQRLRFDYLLLITLLLFALQATVLSLVVSPYFVYVYTVLGGVLWGLLLFEYRKQHLPRIIIHD